MEIYEEYQPTHNLEAGLNYGLYYCPICEGDTLHEVVNIVFDNYDVKCSHCGTTSITRVDYFDSYEDEVFRWEKEIVDFLPDAEDLI